MTLSPTLELAMDLIRRKSVTPDDAGCQELVMSRLAPLGFGGEHLRFGETDNLWARKGTDGPLLAFAGHTDDSSETILAQRLQPRLPDGGQATIVNLRPRPNR